MTKKERKKENDRALFRMYVNAKEKTNKDAR
jgi:hypothetical protein